MTTFVAKVFVKLKPGILDPQGEAIANALRSLGFEDVENARTGKVIELKLAAHDRQEAEEIVQQASERLLANPVIEEYSYDIRNEPVGMES